MQRAPGCSVTLDHPRARGAGAALHCCPPAAPLHHLGQVSHCAAVTGLNHHLSLGTAMPGMCVYAHKSINATAHVLLLAGVEIIFFPVADPVLCFGFSMGIMLIRTDVVVVAELCLLQVKDFPVSQAGPASRGTRSCVGARPGELAWTGQRDSPLHRTSASTKLGLGAVCQCCGTAGSGW